MYLNGYQGHNHEYRKSLKSYIVVVIDPVKEVEEDLQHWSTEFACFISGITAKHVDTSGRKVILGIAAG